MKLITIDIDGILNNYPICWINYVNNELGTSYQSKEEIKSSIGIDEYNKIKDKYRNSYYKANIMVNYDSLRFLNRLSSEGDFVIFILTSRPILDKKRYPNLEQLTLKWLIKNNIPFDNLHYKFDDHFFLEMAENYDYICHIDDDLQDGLFFAKRGIQTIIFSLDDIKNVPYNNLIFIQKIDDLLFYINNRIKKDILREVL